MNFYLAGKYEYRLTLAHVATELQYRGYLVSARWLNGCHDGNPLAHMIDWAAEDLTDIARCSHFVLFNLPYENPDLSNGRHIEFGYALALHKQCCIIGGGESIFYAKALRFKTIEDFLSVWPSLHEAEHAL